MGEAPDGGADGSLIRRTLPRGERCDAGGPAVVHYLQCGGERSGPPLGIPDGRRGWV